MNSYAGDGSMSPAPIKINYMPHQLTPSRGVRRATEIHFPRRFRPTSAESENGNKEEKHFKEKRERRSRKKGKKKKEEKACIPFKHHTDSGSVGGCGGHALSHGQRLVEFQACQPGHRQLRGGGNRHGSGGSGYNAGSCQAVQCVPVHRRSF